MCLQWLRLVLLDVRLCLHSLLGLEAPVAVQDTWAHDIPPLVSDEEQVVFEVAMFAPYGYRITMLGLPEAAVDILFACLNEFDTSHIHLSCPDVIREERDALSQLWLPMRIHEDGLCPLAIRDRRTYRLVSISLESCACLI